MIQDTRNFHDQLPPGLKPILLLAMDQFQLGDMSIHGPVHWLRVFQNATRLAGLTPGADLLVCQLFAVLHDCQRRNESHDPQHGPRAAVFAGQIYQQGKLAISNDQLSLLTRACIDHDRGKISEDPTIGVCWDADRLDLPRVGIRVSQEYLSTNAARGMI